MKTSFNKFIVEPYLTDRALKAKEVNGFAMVQQKTEVKSLTVLVDSVIAMGDSAFKITAGSKIYIREEFLHTQQWAQKVLESASLGKFIIVDPQYVEFVEEM